MVLLQAGLGRRTLNIPENADFSQDTLDTSPLPYSSKEFENMPKARCATCHLSMPVQLLALHAQECEPSSCSDRMDLEPDLDPDLESPATSNPGNPDAEFLMGAISPVFSELGSLRCQRESRIVNFLQDFIQNIEDEEEEKSFVVEERGTPVKITTESDLDDGDSRETESTGEPARDEEEMKEKHKITVGCFFNGLRGRTCPHHLNRE
ncbi:Urocanate reductase [Dissostichus eleginoides]|uniref:Urocanate reductase n=1 Tax=Dissostichus eleginoides TaxID=100907 RepID=A0AAD9FEF1_DISEL|nr:Urocanate reductase [Dissostichus eleginoides]